MVRLSLLALLFAGCAHSMLPGTTIRDTDENRDIVNLVDLYKQAMENLDAEGVLALVSPKYFEDNATQTEDDDYDYVGLREALANDFRRTKALRLELRIDDVQVDDNSAFAEFFYRIRAHNEYPAGLKWETSSDRTRLSLIRENNKWLIDGGL